MPEVSVIIPAFNCEKYIAHALDSVFAQTFQDFEVIVVNDGSTDRTELALSNYRDRIIYLTNDHGGPASSRNRGLDIARGRHVAFLDADDLWVTTKLEKQLDFAKSRPGYGIITTDAANFNETGVTTASAAAEQAFIPSGDVFEHLLFNNWIGTSCALVRRACFEKVGRFDEERFVWGEDWVMWMRVAAEYPVYFINEVLVKYRMHAGGYSRSRLEQHYHDLIYDLDKMERTIPRLTARPALVREAKFRLSWRSGWEDLQSLDVKRARDKLRHAVRYTPLNARAIALLTISCLPLPVLRFLKDILKRGRHMFVPQKQASRQSSSGNYPEH